MKHVVIRNTSLSGWEYGMLRAFEDAIVSITGATVIDIPHHNNQFVNKLKHGTRWSSLRKMVPKKELIADADVSWCILMGPENYSLDFFKNWNTARNRIVYLFDTLPAQYPLIKGLFSGDAFTMHITSFNEAKPDLDKLTDKRWEVIEQAATSGIFFPVTLEEKLIHFSSYGRRYPKVHEYLKKFVARKNLYYDFTTHDGRHPSAPEEDLYRQYAWHLNHSLFTFSWPVELTNPARAGHLHPVTCRWFEAACSGTIILGQKPANPAFETYFPNQIVHDIDSETDEQKFKHRMDELWEKRQHLHDHALGQLKSRHDLTWENRVQRIINRLI